MASKNRRLIVILMVVMALVLTSPALTRAQDDVNAPVPIATEELSPEEQELMVDSPENEVIEETAGIAAFEPLVEPLVEPYSRDRLSVREAIGIGTEKPYNKLEIYTAGTKGGRILAGDNKITLMALHDPVHLPFVEWKQADNMRAMFLGWGNTSAAAGAKRVDMVLENTYNLSIRPGSGSNQNSGRVGIWTTTPRSALDVNGTTTTGVLQITGGGDLAEPFDIASAETVQPGMVVAIDPAHPGQLRIADQSYDRTVAGIVSGAGGINPGLVLQQEGSIAMGEHPVALTGRVYVLADATPGAIQPGDLLTTSDTPGHAMKVADYGQAQGAILGKAMTELNSGTGLVLVLVSLQ